MIADPLQTHTDPELIPHLLSDPGGGGPPGECSHDEPLTCMLTWDLESAAMRLRVWLVAFMGVPDKRKPASLLVERRGRGRRILSASGLIQ